MTEDCHTQHPIPQPLAQLHTEFLKTPLFSHLAATINGSLVHHPIAANTSELLSVNILK